MTVRIGRRRRLLRKLHHLRCLTRGLRAVVPLMATVGVGAVSTLGCSGGSAGGAAATNRSNGLFAAASPVSDLQEKSGQFIAAGSLPDGRLVASYYNETSGQLEVVQESAPGSREFTRTKLGDPENPSAHTGLFSDLKVAADGTIHLVYQQNTDGKLLYSRGHDGQFTVPRVVFASQLKTGGDVQPIYASLVLQGDQIHIAFYDPDAGDLMYTRESLARAVEAGAFAYKARIAKTNDVGRYVRMQAKGPGQFWVAYYDASYGDAYLGALNAPQGGVPMLQPKLIASDGDVGSWMDLAVDHEGNPAMSFYDSSKGDLKFIRPLSAKAELIGIDTIGNVGMDTSLYLDSSGKAHISYLDATNFDLKLAKESSTGSFTTETLDSEGITGFFTRLIPQSEGHDAIFYRLDFYKNPLTNTVVRNGAVLVWPPAKSAPTVADAK